MKEALSVLVALATKWNSALDRGAKARKAVNTALAKDEVIKPLENHFHPLGEDATDAALIEAGVTGAVKRMVLSALFPKVPVKFSIPASLIAAALKSAPDEKLGDWCAALTKAVKAAAADEDDDDGDEKPAKKPAKK